MWLLQKSVKLQFIIQLWSNLLTLLGLVFYLLGVVFPFFLCHISVSSSVPSHLFNPYPLQYCGDLFLLEALYYYRVFHNLFLLLLLSLSLSAAPPSIFFSCGDPASVFKNHVCEIMVNRFFSFKSHVCEIMVNRVFSFWISHKLASRSWGRWYP